MERIAGDFPAFIRAICAICGQKFCGLRIVAKWYESDRYWYTVIWGDATCCALIGSVDEPWSISGPQLVVYAGAEIVLIPLMSSPLFSSRVMSFIGASLFGLAAVVAAGAPAGGKVRVLIVDGQNNHQWPTTTPLVKRILEETGRFTVDVSTSPAGKPAAPRLPANATEAQKAAHAEKVKEVAAKQQEHAAAAPALWAKWRPKFSDYAVVVSNYNGDRWPAEVETAFEAYVRQGGGFVSYHAANNAFSDWPEYNAMIGLGGWGGRNEKSGPYLRLRQLGWIKDMTPGPGGGHGPQHEFVLDVRESDHPIVKGLPLHWKHTKDELYHGLRGPAENVTVLGSALSDRTKEHEPLLMVISYGKGRVFHTALGHYIEAINGAGFQVTLLRGTEWAATGQVTLPAPKAGVLNENVAAVREVKL
jgi:type 1 glutamine amidotransferase